jgi:tRNA(Ile)-lysidine synthase
MSLLSALRLAFREIAPVARGDRVVVAFSGGIDSTALLWGLAVLARRGELPAAPLAAHLDHGLDAGSAERACRAAGLAAALGVPFLAERRAVAAGGAGREAAARQARYRFLGDIRRRTGARWIATAHHRDDQAETVLLRLAFGSGWAGLAGVRPRRGAVVRPLLSLSRADLAAAVRAAGLAPVEDPTNADLRIPRNRFRRLLLPALAAEAGLAPDALAERLARLAARAAGARRATERRLAGAGATPSAIARAVLAELPAPLAAAGLALLHARAGAPYPAAAAARRELARQLASGRAVGCDCGGGLRWEERGGAVVLGASRRARREPPDGFAYTLEVPGDVAIPEIGLRLAVSRGGVAPWMFEGAARRVGLALPVEPGGRLIVRSRRPGDRLHPLGAPGSRRLKELLIDRRVPREARDRLPLLCLGDAIAWVPGVAIDERFRLGPAAAGAWIAELAPAP